MERLLIWIAKGLGIMLVVAWIFAGFMVPLTTLTNEVVSDNWQGWLFLIFGVLTLATLLGFIMEQGR